MLELSSSACDDTFLVFKHPNLSLSINEALIVNTILLSIHSLIIPKLAAIN